ncbi:hypothetical protein CFIICLFH_3943 [Methylobacterium goesingense]|nr:hypothetical protein CFIICLFH_3943 [Methylobacterium goesingense]
MHGVSASAIGTTLGTLTAVKSADTTGTGTGGVIAWSYSVDDAKVEYLAKGQTKVESFTVSLSDGQGGVVTRQIDVTVTGTNDAPVIGAAKLVGAVTEQVSPGSALTDSGTIAFTDVDLTDVHGASASAIGTTLGTLTAVKSADTTGTGMGGVIAWSYSVDDAKVEYLAKGQTKVESFTVVLNDSQGGVVSKQIDVTITGTNDAPILSQDTGTHRVGEAAGVTNGPAILSSSASLAFTDVDLTDTHTASVALNKAVWSAGSTLPTGLGVTLAAAAVTTLADSTGKGAGTIGVAFTLADKLADFLAVGETLTATYDVSVADAYGAASKQQVSFTILGANDAPVIDISRSVTTGSVSELAGRTGSTILDTAAGKIAFADIDFSDRPTASVVAQTIGSTDAFGAFHALTADQANAIKGAFSLTADPAATNNGQVGWSFSLADNALDFLGANERVTLVSTVQVDDHHGGLVNQAVTVSIMGTNDAPTVMADIASVKALLGYTSVDAAHGVLANDSDVDGNGLTVSTISNGVATAAVTSTKGTSIGGDYGTLTIKTDGSYSYDPNVWGLVAQKVPPGIIPIDSFTYTTSDGKGGTSTSQLNMVTTSASQVYVQGSDGNDTLTATPDTSVVGRLFGRDNAMVLNAGNGNDTLTGGKADDVLIAGTGVDKLTGGSGSDTFVFMKNFGKAMVTDFQPVIDQIQFDHGTFANFADLKSHAVQVGADVVITADLDHSVTLQNTQLKTLYASDFHFA